MFITLFGARLDVLEAVEYYEREEGAALADRLTGELESFIERIAKAPVSYREVLPGIRREQVSVSRFVSDH